MTEVDPRQVRTAAILRELSGAGEKAGLTTAGPNLDSGFRAASVDLAAVREILEEGLCDFTMAQVKHRWRSQVFPWLRKTTSVWIQRIKQASFRPEDTGIRVELQTQDDHGYYNYGFDVFPGRESG